MGRGLLGKGDLGPAAGAILMHTTCVRGVPSICDARVISRIVNHATVVRIARARLCRTQEDLIQRRVAAAWDLPKAVKVEMLHFTFYSFWHFCYLQNRKGIFKEFGGYSIRTRKPKKIAPFSEKNNKERKRSQVAKNPAI